MQDYASHADHLVKQIDDGELDPSNVDITPFVEDDSKVFTPALRDRLDGTGLVEEYNERIQERQRESLAKERRDRESEHQDAIEAIHDPTSEEGHHVTVGTVDLTVKAYVNGRIERKVQQVQRLSESDDPDLETAREYVIDVLTWFVTEPEQYTNPEVWREYAENYGTQELARRATEITKPYRERQRELGDVQSFRGE